MLQRSLTWAVESVGWWCVGLSVQIVGGVLPCRARRDGLGQQAIVESCNGDGGFDVRRDDGGCARVSKCLKEMLVTWLRMKM